MKLMHKVLSPSFFCYRWFSFSFFLSLALVFFLSFSLSFFFLSFMFSSCSMKNNPITPSSLLLLHRLQKQKGKRELFKNLLHTATKKYFFLHVHSKERKEERKNKNANGQILNAAISLATTQTTTAQTKREADKKIVLSNKHIFC